MENERAHGIGEMNFGNGGVYVGHFVEGKKSGTGTKTFMTVMCMMENGGMIACKARVLWNILTEVCMMESGRMVNIMGRVFTPGMEEGTKENKRMANIMGRVCTHLLMEMCMKESGRMMT